MITGLSSNVMNLSVEIHRRSLRFCKLSLIGRRRLRIDPENEKGNRKNEKKDRERLKVNYKNEAIVRERLKANYKNEKKNRQRLKKS